MGDDFDYQNAHENFKNIDKLIYHMNERTDYNVFYSTPSCYAYALYQDGDGALGQEWQTKTDDFFPYCDENGRDKKIVQILQLSSFAVFIGPHNYWTGYFTSRPSFKYHERQANALLQSAKQINSFSAAEMQLAGLATLAQAMGISQHHDAVTGTAKTAVDADYNVKLA